MLSGVPTEPFRIGPLLDQLALVGRQLGATAVGARVRMVTQLLDGSVAAVASS